MARRKDETLDGRWLAGELGDLFLISDGVGAVFDWQVPEVYPTSEFAAVAWERVRVRTWQHPDRDEVWPPAGAVHDGLVSRTARCGLSALAPAVQEAVVADLADVERFRADRPDAAEAIAAELDEYTRACELIAGLAARPGESLDAWVQITTRRGHRGQAA